MSFVAELWATAVEGSESPGLGFTKILVISSVVLFVPRASFRTRRYVVPNALVFVSYTTGVVTLFAIPKA